METLSLLFPSQKDNYVNLPNRGLVLISILPFIHFEKFQAEKKDEKKKYVSEHLNTLSPRFSC